MLKKRLTPRPRDWRPLRLLNVMVMSVAVVEGMETAWIVRQQGDFQMFNQVGAEEGQ